MILRVLVAACGALAVTVGLLLAMERVTSLFDDDIGERVYRAPTIIPRPDLGRPDRPQARSLPPETGEAEVEETGGAVPIEAPRLFDGEAVLVPAPEVERLGESAVSATDDTP